MREKLETLPVAELRELAKAQGLKGVSSMRKAELIELLCQQAEKNPQVKPTQAERPAEASPASAGADRENARASRGNDRDTAQQSRGNERDTYRARGNDRDNTQPASQDREAQSTPRAQESQRQPRGPVVYDSRQGRTDSRMADPRRNNRPYDKNGQSGGNRYY
ncbi:Rho termination factor N-terminal domain-containing protein, partial [Enterocloster asparagiformis]|uniref:Rho termination factor N-terminal domain-containing protein n=1 Tax=Enterocloster asparagiformis TaxID=333367 RepID=UPI002A80805B